MAFTPRLDALEAMQSRPIGTNTALYRDPATQSGANDYNRTREEFNMARRLLRREARRGDSGAALGLIELRDRARNAGIDMGGIMSAQTRQANERARAGMLARGAADMGAANDINRGLSAGRVTAGTAPGVAQLPDAAAPGTGFDTPAMRGNDLPGGELDPLNPTRKAAGQGPYGSRPRPWWNSQNSRSYVE